MGSRQGIGLKAALRKERFDCLTRQVGEVIPGVKPFDAEPGPPVVQKACDEALRLLLDGKMRSEMILQIVEASEGKGSRGERALAATATRRSMPGPDVSDMCPLNS